MDYQTDFVCTYQIADDDDLYRSQFLQAFGIEDWNDNIIAIKTDALFKVVEKDFEPILACLRSGKTRFTHLMIMMGQHELDGVDGCDAKCWPSWRNTRCKPFRGEADV